MTTSFSALLELCKAHPGEVAPSKEVLVPLLKDCWHEFAGDTATLASHKLDRIENPTVEWPHIRFEIERHGAIVGGGSSRAEMHHWDINLAERTARQMAAGYRQVYPQQRRLDTLALAHEVADIVKAGTTDPRVSRREDGTVKVEIGLVIPDEGANQTTATRRKRFRKQLEQLLGDAGYRKFKENWFQPSQMP